MIELGVISVILAAKVNEHFSPSFDSIIQIINKQHDEQLVSFRKLLEIEQYVLTILQFELQSETPLLF